jgi:hypothetical protein
VYGAVQRRLPARTTLRRTANRKPFLVERVSREFSLILFFLLVAQAFLPVLLRSRRFVFAPPTPDHGCAAVLLLMPKRGCPTLGLEGWVLLSLSCSLASRINLADQFRYIPRICYRLPFAFGLVDQIVIRFVCVDKPDYLDEMLKPTTR